MANTVPMKNKIRFLKADELFLKELNQQVDHYFKLNKFHKQGNIHVHMKAITLFLIYVILSTSIFFANSVWELYTYYILLGPVTVFVALNIGHEAAHNIFSKKKRLNELLVYIFDLLGANGKIWKHKHVHSHHPHTNIHEVDLELKQPAIVRIFPQSVWKIFHKYQHLYMPIIYCNYTLIWFCFRDFKDYLALKEQMSKGQPIREAIQFLLGKLFFISRLIIMPMIILPFDWYVILGGFVMTNLISSITVTFALISTHVGEHSEFPDTDKNGNMSHSWVKHQFLTTSDFAVDNPFVTSLYGGFNHHLTHHLFPFVSHVHYPAMTKIISELSVKYGFTAHKQKTILKAIRSHFKLLRIRGNEGEKLPDWIEI